MNLLIGATGFIGSHLAKFLFEKGEISKAVFRKGAFLKVLDYYGIQCIEVDFSDVTTLKEPLHDVDTVYFLSFPNPNFTDEFDSFLDGPLKKTIEAIRYSKVKKVVSLSTTEVYHVKNGMIDLASEEPRNSYSRSKYAAERMMASLESSGIGVSIVRSVRAIGRYDKTLSYLLAEMINRGKVVIQDFDRMSFSHPIDISNAMYLLSKSSAGIKVLAVKSFDCSSEELVLSIAKQFGKKVNVKKANLFNTGPFPKHTKRELSEHLTLDSCSEWEKIGYRPSVTLDYVAKEICDWYRGENYLVKQG